jgi:hypothetical protein
MLTENQTNRVEQSADKKSSAEVTSPLQTIHLLTIHYSLVQS